MPQNLGQSTTDVDSKRLNKEPTSSNRFMSWCSSTNWLMFPFVIHADTIANSASVAITPISGSTFGCRRALHDTTSLQNLCTVHNQFINSHKRNRARLATYVDNRLQVTCGARLQCLDGDLPPLVVALRYISEFAMV